MAEYCIVSEDCAIARICNIKLFGLKVTIPAIFCDEETALNLLFVMEEHHLIQKGSHTVREITAIEGLI